MLKSFVIIVPMVLGAVLARVAHADTVFVSEEDVPPAVSQAHTLSPAIPAPTSVQYPVPSTSGAPKVTFMAVGPVDSATHLPEPAVWAMLLVGFGTTGAFLRRRRAGLTAA
jgi:hypothetical protein